MIPIPSQNVKKILNVQQRNIYDHYRDEPAFPPENKFLSPRERGRN